MNALFHTGHVISFVLSTPSAGSLSSLTCISHCCIASFPGEPLYFMNQHAHVIIASLWPVGSRDESKAESAYPSHVRRRLSVSASCGELLACICSTCAARFMVATVGRVMCATSCSKNHSNFWVYSDTMLQMHTGRRSAETTAVRKYLKTQLLVIYCRNMLY